jgi:uncharacterized protein (DUF433 family)
MLLDDLIWIDRERMGGQPCFRGSRVPVQHLIDYIEGGSTLDEFLKDFPTVSRHQAIELLKLGQEQLIECVSCRTIVFAPT